MASGAQAEGLVSRAQTRGGRGSLGVFGTSLAIQGLNVVSGVITARALGPSGKGLLTAVLLWPSLLLAVGALDLGASVTFFSARGAANQRQITATGLAIALTISVILMGIGYPLMHLVLGHYGSSAVFAAQLFLAWLPLTLLTITMAAVPQGRLAFGLFNAIRLSVVVVIVLALLGLWFLDRVSVVNVVWVTLAANVVALLLAIAVLRYKGWFGIRPNKRLFGPILTYALKSHTEAIALLANLRADQAVISLFLASAALGQYAVAVTLAGAVAILATSLATVAFPTIAGDLSVSARSSAFARYVRVAFTLSLLAAVLLVAFAPMLISTFFGRAFLPATLAAQVLIFATVIVGTNRVLSAGIKANNLPLVPGIAEGIALVVTVLSLAVLLRPLGITGAAIASLFAYAASFGYLVWFSVRRLAISPLQLLVPTRLDFEWVVGQLWSRR